MDLYNEAAAILEKFENKQGSVKSLVFASQYRNVRQLYALVCESLKYQPILTAIFKGCPSMQQEETLQGQGHLATVLLYEHLVGKGLGRAGKIRSCVVKHKREIQEKCQELLNERGVTSLADLLSSQCQALNKLPIPRYVRVNLLKTNMNDTVAMFTEQGWIFHGPLHLHDFQTQVQSLREDRFAADPLLTDVLIFPPGTDLHDHRWVLEGCLVLQDRASCFPAHVLKPPEGVTVLDCCAAPGNKTSHAASLLGNSGRILAYERDGKRMALLQQQLRKTGVTNAKTYHQDFLSVNPRDPQFADVQFIMVDPSCSGSGIISRMDHINNSDNNNSSNTSQRLLSLQRFQISILKHALQFPSAQRVVYSTCSVHEEENEQVVKEVAQQVQDKFYVKNIFPEFSHRGKGSSDLEKNCVRMSPKKDLTNGFFVACFERVLTNRENDSGEEMSERNELDNVEKVSRKTKKRKQTEDSRIESMSQNSECSNSVNKSCLGGRNETDSEKGEKVSGKNKKRKHQKDTRTEGLTPNSECSHGSDMEVRERNERDSEKVEKVSRKNRKRKRQEDNGMDSVMQNSECSNSNAFSSQNEEEEAAASPKKKKKKKKKEGENDADSTERIDSLRDNSTSDCNTTTKKKKKLKKATVEKQSDVGLCDNSVRMNESQADNSARVNESQAVNSVRVNDSQADTSISDSVTAKKFKKKKRKMKDGNFEAKNEPQNQLELADSMETAEAEVSSLTCVNQTVKKSKKKKRKNTAEGVDSFPKQEIRKSGTASELENPEVFPPSGKKKKKRKKSGSQV